MYVCVCVCVYAGVYSSVCVHVRGLYAIESKVQCEQTHTNGLTLILFTNECSLWSLPSVMQQGDIAGEHHDRLRGRSVERRRGDGVRPVDDSPLPVVPRALVLLPVERQQVVEVFRPTPADGERQG
jgi:hypothetical protein